MNAWPWPHCSGRAGTNGRFGGFLLAWIFAGFANVITIYGRSEPLCCDTESRGLMGSSIDRPPDQAAGPFSTEERYRVLTTILESFITTLDLQEVLRRIVTIT